MTRRRAIVLPVVCAFSAAACLAQQYVISTVAGGAPPPTLALASSTSIGAPQYLATDSANAVYVTSGHCILKLTTDGLISRIAGNARAGYSGDGGSALIAQFSSPAGLAVDATGNVFVADTGNNRIREIAANGVITTVAGNGLAGFAGDGGSAVSAQLSGPAGIAVDAQGNLFIADTGNNRIRKVSPAGIITTLAGNGNAAFAGDGGSAVNAQLSATSIAIDPSGNIYVGDTGNYRVRKIVTSGIISTVAGSGFPGNTGDGGSALAAQLSIFHQLAVDSVGNIYIADTGNSTIRQVVSGTGTIATVAGNGGSGYFGDSFAATLAALSFPTGVALDTKGDIVIADTANFRIRVVGTDGKIASAAGTGNASYSGDGRAPLSAQFLSPRGLALDSTGNLYIADSGNNRVREVPVTGTVSTFAGNGIIGNTGDGALATNAQLSNAQDIALTSAGQMFIADTGNSRVRSIVGGNIDAFAGAGNSGFTSDGEAAVGTGLSAASVAVDAAGNVYIGDPVNHRVREVLAVDGTIATIAGNGLAGFSGDDGPAANAKLSTVAGVAVDTAGTVYFVDAGNQRVRKVSSNGIITTVVGTGVAGFSGDGSAATSAQLRDPTAIAVDTSSNIYIADTGNHRVRKVAASGTITTIAGNGSAGYIGDGGVSTSASLWSPAGLAVTKSGAVYVSDTGNNAIRLLTPTTQTVLINSVVDAGSETPTSLSPGKIIVIYGAGLGPAQLVVNQPINGIFGQQLAGTTVSIRGITAPIYYTSATQVAVIVPYEITASTVVPVVVAYQSGVSLPFNVAFAPTSPGFFTANATGAGQLAALNPDATLNSAANPVKTGAYISLYATGEGATSPVSVDGKLAPLMLPIPAPIAKVTATIGGIDAKVLYAGSTPGTVAGLLQLNLEIPAAVTPGGYVPVVVTIGGISTVTGAVSIAVTN